MSAPGKGADGVRKQAGSPVDGGQRKPPAQKAWTQGTNPITQRPSNLSNSNGVVNTPKPAPNSSTLSGETASPMKHMNDRMMYLLASLTGLPSNITLKNGEKYTGVLSGTSLDPTEMRYVFKMVKRVQPANDAQVNGANEMSDDYVGTGDYHVMSFDIGDVADLHTPNVVLDKSQTKAQNGVSPGFRTDTDISGNIAVRERNLQKWEPSADANANLSLEPTGRSTEWDQFSTNEQLFGVKSNYDESYYTTTIDRSNPQYAERAARAEKIAREIEASSALNAHVREERGQLSADDKGADEEEKYSGVRRDFPPLPSGQSNKYMPPARRPPTSQPTVPGAPHDPAIISSQIARPESTSSKPVQRTTPPPIEKRATPEGVKSEVALKVEGAPPAAPSKQEPLKDASANPETKTAPPGKPVVEQPTKPSAAFKPTVSGIPARKSGRPDNATANVEHDLLDSFKQFSAAEKLRMSERQRSLARESKAVKLNDLKKFSQNFKLNTPVPQDLVPILAKDENKQQAIVEKALRAVQEMKSTPPKAAPTPVEQKPNRTVAAKPEAPHPSPSTSVDRQQNQRPRPGQNHYGSATVRDRTGPNQNMNQGAQRNTGLLSTRLQLNQQQHKQQGALPFHNIPHPIPQNMQNPPPTGPSASSSGVQTPTSSLSTRFNVRAPDFKPNPAASTFQPGGSTSNNSSPRPDSSSRQEPPRKPQITSFFGGQRPTSEPLDLTNSFNPIKRMMKEAHDENRSREYASNGGIPCPFRTPPTWDFPQTNQDRSYIDMFERTSVAPPVSAPHPSMSNGPIPHQHQLPPHLQGGPQHMPQGQTPQHTPRHPPVQPHHGQPGPHHFESQHMQFSHSTSSVQPSPRAMPPYINYAQPQNMPGFPPQVPMQGYGMSPNVQHVALRQQGGQQFVQPPAPGMGGQMMTNQPSNGPFMGMPSNPQMPMYSPAPGPAYPHYPSGMPAPPGTNGFPSPRPGGAPLMSHQGSQQGHQPQQLVYMQHGTQVPPMFAQMPPGQMAPMRGPYPQPHQSQYGSPHQHHQFPLAHRGTPSGNYSQPMMQQHSMGPQVPPPTGPANHGPEIHEEVK
ncbi:uncharacterized protein BDR25DRAFT_324831 [Lindgomyces ingoldianus]|uniref:Uncharacterized protein n=1 Tax=Lindgomyces ingoldianus TaxID=673940 RepID=A0ACB6QXN0_9PLEO|nr:uncharacterized protein BDR25DRAFT_324831 [Lindgomyces ingoldianus]KAF2471641.1 hypothetical protein BDR25DRAFT_324831 [Lindgomyces ingoldianus]